MLHNAVVKLAHDHSMKQKKQGKESSLQEIEEILWKDIGSPEDPRQGSTMQNL